MLIFLGNRFVEYLLKFIFKCQNGLPSSGHLVGEMNRKISNGFVGQNYDYGTLILFGISAFGLYYLIMNVRLEIKRKHAKQILKEAIRRDANWEKAYSNGLVDVIDLLKLLALNKIKRVKGKVTSELYSKLISSAYFQDNDSKIEKLNGIGAEVYLVKDFIDDSKDEFVLRIDFDCYGKLILPNKSKIENETKTIFAYLKRIDGDFKINEIKAGDMSSTLVLASEGNRLEN